MTAGRVLITGGSAGLGKAIGDRFQEDGYAVVSVDRSPPVSGEFVHIECDLSDRAAVMHTLPAIVAAGPFEFVFLNAGASATGPFEDIPVEIMQKLMRLNAEAPMIIASYLMREKSVTAGLCFVSSLSHFTGYPGAAAYAASKDALAVYAKSVRKPFSAAGVSVTLACPGPLRTDHAERHAPPDADASKRMAPEAAAAAIVAATKTGRRLIIPGSGPKLFALAGKLAPGFVIRQMRKLIYEKLDKPVW